MKYFKPIFPVKKRRSTHSKSLEMCRGFRPMGGQSVFSTIFFGKFSSGVKKVDALFRWKIFFKPRQLFHSGKNLISKFADNIDHRSKY